MGEKQAGAAGPEDDAFGELAVGARIRRHGDDGKIEQPGRGGGDRGRVQRLAGDAAQLRVDAAPQRLRLEVARDVIGVARVLASSTSIVVPTSGMAYPPKPAETGGAICMSSPTSRTSRASAASIAHANAAGSVGCG